MRELNVNLRRAWMLGLALVLASGCGGGESGPVSIGGGGGVGGSDSGATADATAGDGAGTGGGDAGSGGASDGGTDAASGGDAGAQVDVGTFGGVTKPTEAIEVTGLWRIGDFANVHLNSVAFGKVQVVHYDNTKNLAYTTAPVGVSGPGGVSREGVFSVYQWVEPKAGVTHLCQVDTNLSTEVAALQSTKKADPSDLSSGCNLGPWTELKTFELAGVWQSSFGGNEVIDPLLMGITEVVEWDNAANVVYTRNPEGIGSASGLHTKIVWTEFAKGPVWYCKVAAGLKTLAEAKASTASVDDSDPDVSGCNGFGWTRLEPLSVLGSYATQSGALQHITRYWWGDKLVAGFDNSKREAYLRNSPQAAVEANRYSKLLWTKPVKGGFWGCIVDQGLPDLDSAVDSAQTASDADPATGGCQGKPWVRYDPI